MCIRDSANITAVEKASLILFNKWLPRLQGDQLVKLMHTVQLKRVNEDQIAKLDAQVTDLNLAIAARDKQINALNKVFVECDTQITAIFSSTSWRVTNPLRWLGRQLMRMRHLLHILPGIVEHEG